MLRLVDALLFDADVSSPTSRAEVDDIKSDEIKSLEKAADAAGVKAEDVKAARKENEDGKSKK